MTKFCGITKRKFVHREVDDLIPYARNSRTHSEAQIEQIAASIREFGWTNPLLIDESGNLIAGHGRLLAAAKLGIKEAPCIVIDGLSDAQRRALIIADNKLALNAGWDESLLATELEALLADKTDGLTDPDDVPEPPVEPVTKPGDVWLLGKHRIVCGDSTDPLIVGKVGGSGCSVLLSDPPYGLGYEYAEHDDSDNDENAQLVADAFSLGPDPKVWTPGLNNLARDIGRFGRSRIIVWSKGFAAAGNGLGGASTWEPILTVGHTPERKLNNDVLTVKTDRLTVDGKNLRDLHSCPKPVALYEALVEALTKAGQKIYEPFSGSGTTIIACEKSGRECRAVEITPAYVDVAVIRWQEFTGQEATLEAEGRTFAAVATTRAAEAREAA